MAIQINLQTLVTNVDQISSLHRLRGLPLHDFSLVLTNDDMYLIHNQDGRCVKFRNTLSTAIIEDLIAKAISDTTSKIITVDGKSYKRID